VTLRKLSPVLVALLVACAHVPDLPPSPQPRTARQLSESTDLAGGLGDWPTTAWWTAYGDPQLNRLVEEGLRDAPSMAIAQARLLRAQAMADATSAVGQPQIDLNAQVQQARPSERAGIPVTPERQGWNETGQTAVAFRWSLDFWGRNRASLQASLSQVRVMEAERATARLVLASAIADEYAALSGRHRDREDAERLLRLRQRTLDIVRARVEVGVDTELALRQAEAGLHSIRGDLVGVNQSIQTSALRLAALVGAGPDRAALLDAPIRATLHVPALPSRLPASLLGRRPDLIAARWRVEAGRHSVDAADRSFYPNVDLLGLVGFQSLGLGQLFRGGASFGNVGPALTLPIFDGGQRAAAYTVSRADYDIAIASYDGSLAEALREIATALGSIRALDLQSVEADAALNATQRASDLALLRYETGSSNFLEVLVAQERHIQQQHAVRVLQSNRFKQDVALQHALGGGYLQDLRSPAP
jgi:NodT family efflux transporter outer membrane factor (OMF) lipoprotein